MAPPTRVVVNEDHVLAYYDGEDEPRKLTLDEAADVIGAQIDEATAAAAGGMIPVHPDLANDPDAAP